VIQVNIEIDSVPHFLHEKSLDWSGLSITGLIAQPLFFEGEDRTINSGLVEKFLRRNATTWDFFLSQTAQWSNGTIITAHDVCRQIKRIYQTKAAVFLLVLHINNIRVIDDHIFRIETYGIIENLDRILTNPAFSPRHENPYISSGEYYVADSEPGKLTLQSHDGHKCLNIIEHKVGVDLFSEGRACLSGPMTINPKQWRDLIFQDNTSVFDLDILYVLGMPSWLSSMDRHLLMEDMDRNQVCSALHGMVTPCKSLCIFEHGEVKNQEFRKNLCKYNEDIPYRQSVPILYTDFTGNKEMAYAVAAQIKQLTGIGVIPTICSYKKFLARDIEESAFKIMLISSLWPHPASFLTPFRFSSGISEDFTYTYDKSLAEDDLSWAHEIACLAEEKLGIADLPIVPIGRVKGCFRSYLKSNWWPPSGWLNKNLLKLEEIHAYQSS